MSDSLIVGGETGRWGEGEGSSAAGGGGKIVNLLGDPVPDPMPDPMPDPIPDPAPNSKTSKINTPLDRVEC